jgi:hypothetical protein
VYFLECVLSNIVDELKAAALGVLVALRDMEAVAALSDQMQQGFNDTFGRGVPRGYLSRAEREARERAVREAAEAAARRREAEAEAAIRGLVLPQWCSFGPRVPL